MATLLTLPSGVPAAKKTKQLTHKEIAPSFSPPSGKMSLTTAPKGSAVKMSMPKPPFDKPKAC